MPSISHVISINIITFIILLLLPLLIPLYHGNLNNKGKKKKVTQVMKVPRVKEKTDIT